MKGFFCGVGSALSAVFVFWQLSNGPLPGDLPGYIVAAAAVGLISAMILTAALACVAIAAAQNDRS